MTKEQAQELTQAIVEIVESAMSRSGSRRDDYWCESIDGETKQGLTQTLLEVFGESKQTN